MVYKHKELSKESLNLLMSKELSNIETKIQYANIPEQNRITADKVLNAKELASCKTIQEAINKGLLESEAVMKRLCINKYGYIHNVDSIGPSVNPNITTDIFDLNELPKLNVLSRSLCRQQSITYTTHTYNKSKSIPSTLLLNQHIKKKRNNVNMSINIKHFDENNTFGLRRYKSVVQNYTKINSSTALPTIHENNISYNIEGSIKCYLREPNVNLGFITDPLLKLACGTSQEDESKFRKLLFQKCPKQYELYVNGGLLNRFGEMPVIIQSNQPNDNTIGLINRETPQITRAFSESYIPNSYNRILRMVSISHGD